MNHCRNCSPCTRGLLWCRVTRWLQHLQGGYMLSRTVPFEHIFGCVLVLSIVTLLMCFWNLRDLQKELAGHFVTCTKEDTMMNVWLVRARSNPQFLELACVQFKSKFAMSLLWTVLYLTMFFCLRKWRPPETDEQKQEKKRKAEESKKRKKDKEENVKKEWCWLAKTRLVFWFVKTCFNTLGLDPQRNGLLVAWRRLSSDLYTDAFCIVTCVSSSLQLRWF